jgi:hypothetical protein
MSLHSSSTSSSEAAAAPRRSDLREAVFVAAWMALFLVAGDLAINRLFPPPRGPKVEPTGPLRIYFNYGWSIEAKLRRAIGPTDETSAPLMLAGWVDRELEEPRPIPEGMPDERVLSVYGMSFSNQIAEAMRELDPRWQLRLFGGPSAPPNHSYAIYERDRGGRSKVVILGVLASSVQGLVTNNGATWRFEGPAPFTYPRYFSGATGLVAEWPMVRTLAEMRARLADPAAWDEYAAQLRTTDAFYNTFLFRHDAGDYSAFVRMIRRAAAQSWQSSGVARIHGPSGFVPDSPAVPSLRGIVAAFAADARRDGKRPIALLIEDRGYRDHLTRILEPILERDAVPFVSTHTICPDTDPRNFIADGHFTPEGNTKIARALLDVIGR